MLSHTKVHHPDQLLRLHILEAQIDTLSSSEKIKSLKSTYAIVKVGPHTARTDVIYNTNTPKFDSQFSIEYHHNDEDSEVEILLMDEEKNRTDERIGEWRMKLSALDNPQVMFDEETKRKKMTKAEREKMKKEKQKGNVSSWVNLEPKTVVFTDKKGNKAGTITFRMRRELKMTGTLQIKLRGIEFYGNKAEQNKEVHMNGKCVMRLLTDSHETPVTESKVNQERNNEFVWDYPCSFDVNDKNNTYDVFIEYWGTDPGMPTQKMCEARLALFDCYRKFDGSLPFIAFPNPGGPSDLSPLHNKSQLGCVNVKAHFKNEHHREKS